MGAAQLINGVKPARLNPVSIFVNLVAGGQLCSVPSTDRCRPPRRHSVGERHKHPDPPRHRRQKECRHCLACLRFYCRNCIRFLRAAASGCYGAGRAEDDRTADGRFTRHEPPLPPTKPTARSAPISAVHGANIERPEPTIRDLRLARTSRPASPCNRAKRQSFDL